MKTIKKFLLILTVLLTFNQVHSYAQAMLNYTASQIKQTYTDPEYKLESGTTDSGTFYMTVTYPKLAQVFYYFDTHFYCNATVIVPMNSTTRNYLIKTYNANYVSTSATTWTAYMDNGVAYITLKYFDDGGYAFYWTLTD